MSKSIRNQLATGVAAAALAVGIFAAAPLVTDLAASQAWAQGQGQGGRGGPAESRGQGAAGGGSAVGGAPAGRGHGQPTTTGAPEGRGGDRGQRGPSADSDGTPHRGQPLPGERGGRPVWAGDGAIPVVELGRLNVARAPARVLEARYAELLANWATIGVTSMTLGGVTYTVAELYSLPAAQFAALLAAYYDQITRIDSPLENLGLLRTLYLNPSNMLPGVTPASTNDLAAIAIASASDKTIPVTNETVIALSTILGLNILASDVPTIAAAAELVRQAIVAGHG
ncbi:hypothetical protein FHS88_001444 [Roseomonas alkaliterrae]|uniref:Uncharacterized protein n=1 Tax=Neoroseomonas alkaliterrae TaxID=1452450 RepID=A0A840XRL9_9PROT|nr:hypothetical protein [Neoroseomonas alkaliterrae]MBB5689319.1 hypothetical protein [Neoroseomonas alkaliterrae]